MATFESKNELDLGNGKRLSLIGANFIKTLYPSSWVKRLYTIDFSGFITSIANSISFNSTTGVLISNVNGSLATTTIADATTTNKGLVNNTTQSFSGNKTFTGNVSVDGNTTIGNANTDRVTINSQILGSSPLVFQGGTDNTFTQTFTFIEPTVNNTSTFRNVTGQVAHIYHNSSFAMVVGTNTITHNLNLTNFNAVIVQAFDATTNQQVILNMSSATANTFQFVSSMAGTIRVTVIG